MGSFDSIVAHLAIVLGASWCAGINVYATVAVLGIMARFIPGFDLPDNLNVLQNNWVIIPAVTMYCAEFVADKVPAFDTFWDTIHTFIRVPAGAVLAAAAVGTVPPEVQVAAGILGGTLALGSHTTKATTRLVAHGTGTSPLVSPLVSVAEDGLVIGTIGLLSVYPEVTLWLTVIMIAGASVMMYFFWNVARKLWRSISAGRTMPGQSGNTTANPALPV